MKIALILLASLAVLALTTTAVSATPDEEGSESVSPTTAAPKKGWFEKAKDKAKKVGEKIKEGAKTVAKKVKEGVDHVVNKIKGKKNDNSTESPMDNGTDGIMTESSGTGTPEESADIASKRTDDASNANDDVTSASESESKRR